MENNYKSPELLNVKLDEADVITASMRGIETSLHSEQDAIWQFNVSK